jgi:branched-chain amino acid transport system substrate-binding protein
MGINFIKQYVGAGLGKDTTLLCRVLGRPDVINPVGASMAGSSTPPTGRRLHERREPEVRRRVREGLQACRLYASQGWPTLRLIGAAVRDTRASWTTRARAEGAQGRKFDSVRGRSGSTPTSTRSRTTTCAPSARWQGRLINKSFNEPILKNHGDAYVQSCAMK